MINSDDNIHFALEKIAGREGAAIGGAVPGILGLGAPVGAEEGKRTRAWLGALGGQIVGGAAGAHIGRGGILPVLAGAAGGGYLGAHYAHGPDKKKGKSKDKKKTASVARAQTLVKKFWSDVTGKSLAAAKGEAKSVSAAGREKLRSAAGGTMEENVKAWQKATGASGKAGERVSQAAKDQLRARLAAGGVGVAGAGGTAYALRGKK